MLGDQGRLKIVIPIRVIKDSIKYEGDVILLGTAFCISLIKADGIDLEPDMLGYNNANKLLADEYTKLAKQYGPSLSGRAS